MDLKFAILGQTGDELSGIESRVLRTALNLQREHVMGLANALGAANRRVTPDLVVNWERAKGRGYPHGVVDALNSLDSAVQQLAVQLAYDAAERARGERSGDQAEVCRPTGADRISRALSRRLGVHISPKFQSWLNAGRTDFWDALADVAVVRAVMVLKQEGWRIVRVLAERGVDDGGPSTHARRTTRRTDQVAVADITTRRYVKLPHKVLPEWAGTWVSFALTKGRADQLLNHPSELAARAWAANHRLLYGQVDRECEGIVYHSH